MKGLAAPLAAAAVAGAGSLAHPWVGVLAGAAAGAAIWWWTRAEAPPPRPAEDTTRLDLLTLVLDEAPLAVVLADMDGRVALANRTARDLFAAGSNLEGRDFERILAESPPEMASAIRSQSDVLFTVEGDDGDEAYHITRPLLEMKARRYRLYLVKELTRELNRQEVAIWKKMIRVVSHELNNSLAPIGSMLHSARLILDKPEHLPRLVGVFDTIEERTRHLQTFIEGYARFARLAPPTVETVSVGPFLRGVAQLSPCRVDDETGDATGDFDRVQLQQALINLLKNALEAQSPEDEIMLRARTDAHGGLLLSVLDRGTGMSEAVARQALLPFYSTKQRGTGLGLAVVREVAEAHGGSVRVEQRPGGGAAVHLSLPPEGP
jgi:two-component system, NtrC family, nitrogen regulation sensor histidine kinase NtrY